VSLDLFIGHRGWSFWTQNTADTCRKDLSNPSLYPDEKAGFSDAISA